MVNDMQNNLWWDKISDILIVVVGILIALGLDSWYDDRKEAKLEQQYLSTFLEDISADIENLKVDREFADEQHYGLSENLFHGNHTKPCP